MSRRCQAVKGRDATASSLPRFFFLRGLCSFNIFHNEKLIIKVPSYGANAAGAYLSEALEGSLPLADTKGIAHLNSNPVLPLPFPLQIYMFSFLQSQILAGGGPPPTRQHGEHGGEPLDCESIEKGCASQDEELNQLQSFQIIPILLFSSPQRDIP